VARLDGADAQRARDDLRRLELRRLTLYAATARSSNATAVLRNARGCSVTPSKSNVGRFTARLPRMSRKAVTCARSTAPTFFAAVPALPVIALDRSASV
jgi:hypothetical protein